MLLEPRASHVERKSIPDHAVAVSHGKQSEQSILPAVPCPRTSRLSTFFCNPLCRFQQEQMLRNPCTDKEPSHASSRRTFCQQQGLQGGPAGLKGGRGFKAKVQDTVVQPEQAVHTAHEIMQATEWCMPGVTFLRLLCAKSFMLLSCLTII